MGEFELNKWDFCVTIKIKTYYQSQLMNFHLIQKYKLLGNGEFDNMLQKHKILGDDASWDSP